MKLFRNCIYTIAHPSSLRAAQNQASYIKENKVWRQGLELLNRASDEDHELPILFADSRDTSNLIAWAIVKEIKLGEGTTCYKFGALYKISESTPQDLIAISTGKYISEGHIRPYVLCRTPSFVFKDSKNPRLYSPGSKPQKNSLSYLGYPPKIKLTLQKEIPLELQSTSLKGIKQQGKLALSNLGTHAKLVVLTLKIFTGHSPRDISRCTTLNPLQRRNGCIMWIQKKT